MAIYQESESLLRELSANIYQSSFLTFSEFVSRKTF